MKRRKGIEVKSMGRVSVDIFTRKLSTSDPSVNVMLVNLDLDGGK